MKKLLRAAVLTVVMFAGANAQAVRDQGEGANHQQTQNPVGPGKCIFINGSWICDY